MELVAMVLEKRLAGMVQPKAGQGHASRTVPEVRQCLHVAQQRAGYTAPTIGRSYDKVA